MTPASNATAAASLTHAAPPTQVPEAATDGPGPRPVAVSELKRAWTALQAGVFRRSRVDEEAPGLPAQVDGHPEPAEYDEEGDPAEWYLLHASPPRPAQRPQDRWTPAPRERVLPVIGAAGSVGCSTVVLALITALAESVTEAQGAGARCGRIVECCSASTSGLVAASSAELGCDDSGWVSGTRGPVLLHRVGAVLVCPGQVPVPAPLRGEGHPTEGQPSVGTVSDINADETVTLIDTGWEVGQLMADAGWLGDLVRRATVVLVVARPTIPGFRRLEAALELLEAGREVSTLIALVGGRRQRWAKGVEHSAGPRTRAALREDRIHEIPEDRDLVVAGLSSGALPRGLIVAAGPLLHAALHEGG